MERIDAATLASRLQLREQRRELIYSCFALTLKFGLIASGAVSLVKLCVAYQQRHDRHSELATVLTAESSKLNGLQKRFDRLFTIGGGKRLLDEQDQWIKPNRLRVMWR